MAIWIKGPDPEGNCCECDNRTSPCDSCAPTICSCYFTLYKNFVNGTPFDSYEEALAAIELYSLQPPPRANNSAYGAVNPCYGDTCMASTFLTNFNTTYGYLNFYLSGNASESGGMGGTIYTSISIKNGKKLTIEVSLVNSGNDEGEMEGRSFVLIVYKCSDGTSEIRSGGFESSTFEFDVEDGEYVITYASKFNGPAIGGYFGAALSLVELRDIDNNLLDLGENTLIAELRAPYLVGETTYYVYLPNKLRAPILNPSYYANQATAQAALDARASNCIGFFNGSTTSSPTPVFSIDASATAIYLKNGKTSLFSTPSAGMFFGFKSLSAGTITISFSVEGFDSLNSVVNRVSASVALYNSAWTQIDYQIQVGAFPSSPSINPTVNGNFTVNLPSKEVYYIYIAIGNVTSTPQQSCEYVEGNIGLTYSASKELFDIQALYYGEFVCPSKLNCY
jgi:hypothetical protein